MEHRGTKYLLISVREKHLHNCGIRLVTRSKIKRSSSLFSSYPSKSLRTVNGTCEEKEAHSPAITVLVYVPYSVQLYYPCSKREELYSTAPVRRAQLLLELTEVLVLAEYGATSIVGMVTRSRA